MILPVVVLLPGPDVRVLGMSVRTRNERVARRAGASVMSAEDLARHPNASAVLVPADRLIDLGRFPPATSDAMFDVSTPAARRRAAWTILRSTGKASDGWISRHWNRPISRLVSFALLGLGLRANHASILTLVVGLASAAIAAEPGYVALVTMGVLFQLASVVDGVDGEMARATLTESEAGARLDTIVDQVTYVACFVGAMVGWAREGGGTSVVIWAMTIAGALILSLLRAGRFVSRYAPNASFVFVDRSVRRAASDTGRPALRAAAALFALLRRDLFAVIFLAVSFTGQRVLIPALVVFGIVVANVTFSVYRRELDQAAVALRAAH